MIFSLFWTFLKIGLFTFGGGYAMIANIREVIVENKRWLDEDELFGVITVAESTPGPIAINLATYVGYKKRGVWGSVAATLGVVLPSLLIIFIISLFLDAFLANKYVAYAFVGIKCAVAFLILKAGIEMFEKLPKKPLPLLVFGITIALLFSFEWFAINFSSILLILIGGLIGIVAYAIPSAKKEDKK